MSDKARKSRPQKLRRTANRKTCELLGRAAALFAAGKPWDVIEATLSVTAADIRDHAKRHPDLWKLGIDNAMQQQREVIEAMAGTMAILDDPDTYLCSAQRVDTWAAKKGQPLFQPNGQMTLTTFFDQWYIPQRLFDASEATKISYRGCLRQWRLLTGDPNVKQITADTLALFRDALSKCRGLKATRRQSPNSVRKSLRHIQILIDRLGPPGPRRRDYLGILDRPPWTKPPKREQKIPKTVPLDELGAAYTAAIAMEWPKLPAVQTVQWWRSLLAVAYCTGLRARSLFALRWEWVEWPARRVVIPAEAMKSARPIVVYLNAAAYEHLKALRRGGAGLIFPMPLSGRWALRKFYMELHRLQEAAGIPTAKHFGLHRLRSSLATAVAGTDGLSAAQFALGHVSGVTTREHYVDGGQIVAQALDRVPVPAEFQNRPTTQNQT